MRTFVGRRQFISALGGAAVAWPLATRAQQSDRMRRIGVLILNSENDPQGRDKTTALQQELERLGWRIGRNLQIDYRWGASQPERAQAAAIELLGLNPDAIVANSVSAAHAAQQATSTVPIVFTAVSEPISLGLVASLSHPGGNITGFTNLEPSVGAKWLELLKGIAPQVKRVGFLFNPDSTPATQLFYRAIEGATAKFAVDSTMVPVRQSEDIESAMNKLGAQPGVGLIAQPDTFLANHAKQIVDLAAKVRVPVIYPFDFYTTDGGLISYGPDVVDQFRQAASYIDRILKGEKPTDLPVQQPTKFKLVINAKTAKLLDLRVPDNLLAIADEVIE